MRYLALDGWRTGNQMGNPGRSRILRLVAFSIASLVCLNGAFAQATTKPEGDGRDKPILTTQGELDDLRNAIKSLQAQLDQLKSEVRQLRQQVAAAPLGAGTKEAAAQPAAPADQQSPLIFAHVKITKGEFGNDELIGDVESEVLQQGR